MKKSNHMTSNLSHQVRSFYSESKSSAKYWLITLALSTIIFFVIPATIIKVFSFLLIVWSAWAFLFHILTCISLNLQGQSHLRFQIIVSILIPLGLSLYFILDSPAPLLGKTLINNSNVEFMTIFGAITAIVSWLSAGQIETQIETDNRFRAYMTATTILFIVVFFRHSSLKNPTYQNMDNSALYNGTVTSSHGLESTSCFWVFLFLVGISYAAMTIRLLHGKRTM